MPVPVLMRHRLAAGALLLALGACATPPAPLYLWEGFPRQQYDVLVREGASVDEQIRAIEAHAEKARGANAALPPGLRAHLGMLYLQAGQTGQARAMWLAEKAAFPESTVYMDSLLKRTQPAGATQDKAPS